MRKSAELTKEQPSSQNPAGEQPWLLPPCKEVPNSQKGTEQRGELSGLLGAVKPVGLRVTGKAGSSKEGSE